MTSNSTPLVSVVVPCYRDTDALMHCLDALVRQQTNIHFEVIVVDSGGSQGSLEDFVQLDVRVVREQQRLLPGAARNLGAGHACGDLLAFTDADCRPAPNWIDTLASALRSQDGMIGGSVGHVHPFMPIAVADNILQFTDYLPGRPAGPTDHLAACNMAVTRSVFAASGGFPPDLETGEDTKLVECIARKRRDTVRFVPAMRVRHDGRRSIGAMWAHQQRFGYDRARLGLRLTGRLRRALQSRLFAIAYCFRRFAYILYRTSMWHPASLPRVLLFSPWILIGLVAYTRGMHAAVTMAGQDA